MKWYLRAMQNYVTFSGRARRRELWYFFLFYFLAILAVSQIAIMTLYSQGAPPGGTTMFPVAAAINLLVLGHILPALAVEVRRLHDIGRSGWWLLIAALPIIGAIILIFWFVQPGTTGPNRFGADPKAAAA